MSCDSCPFTLQSTVVRAPHPARSSEVSEVYWHSSEVSEAQPARFKLSSGLFEHLSVSRAPHPARSSEVSAHRRQSSWVRPAQSVTSSVARADRPMQERVASCVQLETSSELKE